VPSPQERRGWITPQRGATLRATEREARVTKDGILELEQRRFKAMCDGDAAALGALLHDRLTYTHSSGTVDTKESYTRGVREKLWDYQSIKASNATVSIAGNAALVHCRLRIDVTVRSVPKVVDSVALAVWVDDGSWKCIAVHSTPVPK
jgi:ketosteroid isomerase-like protein